MFSRHGNCGWGGDINERRILTCRQHHDHDQRPGQSIIMVAKRQAVIDPSTRARRLGAVYQYRVLPWWSLSNFLPSVLHCAMAVIVLGGVSLFHGIGNNRSFEKIHWFQNCRGPRLERGGAWETWTSNLNDGKIFWITLTVTVDECFSVSSYLKY